MSEILGWLFYKSAGVIFALASLYGLHEQLHAERVDWVAVVMFVCVFVLGVVTLTSDLENVRRL